MPEYCALNSSEIQSVLKSVFSHSDLAEMDFSKIADEEVFVPFSFTSDELTSLAQECGKKHMYFEIDAACEPVNGKGMAVVLRLSFARTQK